MIPNLLYKNLIYQRAKPFLIKLPAFKEIKSEMCLREVATQMEHVLFLPNDYIIYKGDIGEEMYFLIEGQVQVLGPDEFTVLTTLNDGDYFGEIALFTKSAKRMCSVISKTFCKLYMLKKADLFSILGRFPRMKRTFIKESNYCIVQLIIV